jgi:hypothetical protein
MKEKIPFPESEIVRRVKNERKNPGRNYLEYLSPSERASLKIRNRVSYSRK